MRKWVAEADLDATQFYRAVYDNAEQYIDIKSMPQLVLLIGQYQYQAAFSGDQEINTAAFCTELMMSNTVWK
jgi:replication factor C small subunit